MISGKIDDVAELKKLAYSSPAHREPLIVAAANLDLHGGLIDLVEACRTLGRRRCAFHCEIYGDGPHESQMMAIAEGAGVSPYIRFMGVPTPSILREAVARAAVFAVIGSDREIESSGQGEDRSTEMIDAMALGTPCVVTDDIRSATLIVDGETGLIEPRRDPRALAISLQRLLIDYPLRVRLAREARCVLETKFDLPRSTIQPATFFGAPQPMHLS